MVSDLAYILTFEIAAFYPLSPKHHYFREKNTCCLSHNGAANIEFTIWSDICHHITKLWNIAPAAPVRYTIKST